MLLLLNKQQLQRQRAPKKVAAKVIGVVRVKRRVKGKEKKKPTEKEAEAEAEEGVRRRQSKANDKWRR